MAEKNMSRSPRWFLRVRGWVQVAALVFANSLFIFQARAVCLPVLNCWACPLAAFACPLGALQTAVADMRAVFILPFYILGSLLAVSAVFGRMMCGWLCPFGLLQELLGRLNRRQRSVPGWASYGKYVALVALALIAPYFMGVPLFCKLCPQGALQGGIFQPLLNPELRPLIGTHYWVKMAILAATIAAAIAYRRPFCHVACPLGAIFSLTNRVSLVRLSYDQDACNDCGWCVRVCPQGIDPRTQINSHACIGCLKCAGCPQDAIKVTTALSCRNAKRDQNGCAESPEEGAR
ncbi:MAG: 4Fe-4S binding protein [Armatimonadetes bacterium]|nr:4Fe-4S binding protein [Armatimonadota bacterium]